MDIVPGLSQKYLCLLEQCELPEWEVQAAANWSTDGRQADSMWRSRTSNRQTGRRGLQTDTGRLRDERKSNMQRKLSG